jgi:hypothetical protein
MRHPEGPWEVSRMRMDDVDVEVLRRVVPDLESSFDTYAVSRHPRVRRAHAAWVDDRNYNAIIGKVLRREAAQLGLRYAGQQGSQGSALWDAVGRAPAPSASRSAPPPATLEPAAPGDRSVGPQHAGDTPFQARMRRHQSWYRSEVLGVPWGTGPTAGSTRPLGNMLTAHDAQQGRNFLTPEIHAHYRRRVAGGDPNISGFRCERNMLSSQPMCFNLFAPLADDLDLATRCLQALLPGAVRRVTGVEVEHTPRPKQGYLGDGTSLDALIRYEDAQGARCFLGVETKLHEPVTEAKVYDRPRYRELTEAEGSPWVAGAVDRLVRSPYNQLWRNHLLVEAARRHPSAGYGRGRLMLVWHPADDERTAVVRQYERLLTEPSSSFVAAPLNRLVAAWRVAASDPDEEQWAYRLWLRYVDLEASGSR